VTKWLIVLVLLVPAGVLVWDVADTVFSEPRSEREVVGDNFLEHDRHADALDEVIADGLAAQDVGIVQIVSMRLAEDRWSILVVTGPDDADTERWSAEAAGSDVRRRGAGSG